MRVCYPSLTLHEKLCCFQLVSRKKGFTVQIVVEKVFRITIGGTTKPDSTKTDKVQIVWGLIAAGFYVYAHKNTK